MRQFYEEHRQALYTYALFLVGSPETAEDVVHTAFCRLLRRDRLPREVRPYVFRCVRNAALDERRRAGRDASRQSIFNGHETGPVHIERRMMIEEALSGLDPDQQECIVLKVYNGLTFREIAVASGESVNTVASRYRRGIEKMRARLEDTEL